MQMRPFYDRTFLSLVRKGRFFMEKILLLEAEYKNKFPPIGLMKLSRYHQDKGDMVVFSKGKLKPMSKAVEEKILQDKYYQDTYGDELGKRIEDMKSTISENKWDKIYITTLFTFEWKRTIKLIEYAKTLTDDMSKIVIGGISASLMPDDFEAETGVRPVCGLLLDSAQIGYDDKADIDNLVPDYSILSHIEYEYPFADGYFLSATRGCGMKCSFCAVQTLEPDYIDYVPILPKVEDIRRRHGEKKNLYLLDNNVLKSSKFSQIIDDIKAAGFHRGATIKNPTTGNLVQRHIDFNQGLDMNFFTEKKVKLLSEIAIVPLHIAFDHIDDKGKYLEALTLLDKYDISNICNYQLYNTPDFSGKGKPRCADSPRDLYERGKINAEFTTRVNKRRTSDGEKLLNNFSFPMKYMPLMCKDRTYVGDNWTKKQLAAVRDIVGVMHGGVSAYEDVFCGMLGETYSEFYRNLLMPSKYLKHRVHHSTDLSPGHERYWWSKAQKSWVAQYELLSNKEKAELESVISDNEFAADKIKDIISPNVRKLYYHYFSGMQFIELLKFSKSIPEIHKEIIELLDNCPAIMHINCELLSHRKDVGELLYFLAIWRYNLMYE